jgi:hypothetical protein
MVSCPIINQKEFMDAFEGRTTPPPSRMLLNAMFSVACRHLTSDHPILAHYKLDSKRLYKLFTDRAAVAFTRQYFSPNVSTIQSLLLVLSNPNFTPHGQPNWIWCGMAIRMVGAKVVSMYHTYVRFYILNVPVVSQAQDIGFHRCNGAFKVSPAKEDFARRLWWSTYITDRWTCAMLGRYVEISECFGIVTKHFIYLIYHHELPGPLVFLMPMSTLKSQNPIMKETRHSSTSSDYQKLLVKYYVASTLPRLKAWDMVERRLKASLTYCEGCSVTGESLYQIV